MTTAADLERELIALGNDEIARHSQRFFKTGAGQYGAGDEFLGIRVPTIRATLKQHRADITLNCAIQLLHSKWHETRMFAVLALVDLYKRRNAGEDEKKSIVTAYLKHRKLVNNWDLVDSSAPGISGAWHFNRDRSRLDKMIAAKSLWDRRIAMLSTFYYIRQNDLTDTFKYAQWLLDDSQDLMHKAAGWMLREAGKRDEQKLCDFLDQFAHSMPRTMLRYSIERLPKPTRQGYLQQKGC